MQAPSHFGAALGNGRWMLRDALASSITNRIVAGDGEPDERFGARRLELVALTVVGIYIAGQGFVTLVYDIVIVAMMHRQPENVSTFPPSLYAGIAGAIVQVALGIAICLGARGIMRLVRRLRRA